MSQLQRVSSPHIGTTQHTGDVMRLVILATLPGLLALCWQFGWGSLLQVVWACLVALGAEAFALRLRGRPAGPALRDNSALLTGVLLGLALPPLSPWWLTLTGVLSAILIAKHLYGGLGHNLFNPAMVGYVVLLISFPLQMTSWLPPTGLGRGGELGFLDTLSMIANGQSTTGETVDAFTMATPLDTARIYAESMTGAELLSQPAFNGIVGHGWWIVNLAFLLGGLFLLWKRVTYWHVPVGLLGSLLLLSLGFHLTDPDRFVSPLVHLFSGATMIGAFFIATDPVSCATSPRGRIWFGIGVGCILFCIRTWGSYPDAIAFAVLLMNLCAPLLDQYTRPRTYGQRTQVASGVDKP